jgi:hypothetical protein
MLLSGAIASAQPAKKLIEFGWDEPDTSFMRQHIAAMEESPFDGTVFHVMYTKPDGSDGSFMNECWGKRAFKGEEFSKALADLRATAVKKFKSNFLRFNVCPGDVDFFDDFSAVTGNANLAAQFAAMGGAAGVLFDIEQYNTPLWDYRKTRDAKTKSFDAYAQQARQRGREVMNAFQDGFGDLTVFLTFGYALPHAQVGTDKAKLAEVDYGLLKPFLDGMFEVARGRAKIVEGFEISYGYKTDLQFDAAVETVKKKLVPLVGVPQDQYLKHVSMGFGLWMDNDWRNKGWDVKDFSKNYFTPEQFGKSLTKALATADEYVWIYTEEPKWWTKNAGAAEKLPPEYVMSVRKASGK